MVFCRLQISQPSAASIEIARELAEKTFQIASEMITQAFLMVVPNLTADQARWFFDCGPASAGLFYERSQEGDSPLSGINYYRYVTRS